MICCPQCGFENPDSHNFCQKCGFAISKAPDTSEAQSTDDATDGNDAIGTVTTDVDAPKTTILAALHSSDEHSNERLDTESSAGQSAIEAVDTEKSVLSSPSGEDKGIFANVDSDPLEWLAILSVVNAPLHEESKPLVSVQSVSEHLVSDDSVAVVDQLQERAVDLHEQGYMDPQRRYRVRECLLKTPQFLRGEGIPYLELTIVDERPDEPPYLDQVSSFETDDLSKTDDFRTNDFRTNDVSREGNCTESDRPKVNRPAGSDAEGMSSPDLPETLETSGDRVDDEDRGSRAQPDNHADESPLMHTEPDLDDGNLIRPLTASPLAQVYLSVQDQFYPSLPQVYDAWQSGNISVVIVENRNEWTSLRQALHAPGTPSLQALHWLHEMTELWAVLQPKEYHHSLLDVSNVHVDEDQILCITGLHRSATANDFSLSDLGEFWKRLLDNSPLQANEHLAALCADLSHHKISSIDALRLRLEGIAHALQEEDVIRSEPAIPGDETSANGSSSVKRMEGDSDTLSSDLADGFSGQDTIDEELEVYPESDEVPTVVLPMRLFNLVDAGLTDIGRQRDHNEDYFSIQSEMQKQDTPSGRTFAARGLYILCDGMGGHAAGEVASALAVSTIESYLADIWTKRFPTKEDIRAAIQKANQSIYDLNQENACYGSGRMGTTLVMMLVDDIKVAIAHVGDSRVYRFCRRAGLEQITTDHEVGQREIQRGVEPAIAYARPDAYQLTQALGPRDSSFINPDIQTFEVNEDTLFLMCSDGLSDNSLLEQHYDSHVEPMLSSQSNLNQMIYELVDLANQRNGHDNITAIAIRMKVRPKVLNI